MAKDIIKVITGKVRFSYANVWVPRSYEDGPLKYSVRIIIEKQDKETVEKINIAIDRAIEGGISKFGGEISEDLKIPIHDGDELDDEVYKNCFYVNSSSSIKPEIVDGNLRHITNENEFYSGCYGRASLIFFSYNTDGNKGVGCGLNNLQKLEDGEILTSRSSAEEDFSLDNSYGEEEDFLL